MVQMARRTESVGGTDQRWLGSREGVDTARTITIDNAAWAGKVVNGRLKEGEAVAFNTSTKKYVPYASGGSNGTNQLRGFIPHDQPFRVGGGDVSVPMIDRGRIILKYLPSTVAANATQHATARFSLVDVTEGA